MPFQKAYCIICKLNTFRKNPSHFVEFCHPGDSSFDEDEAEFIRTDKGPRLKRVSIGKSRGPG